MDTLTKKFGNPYILTISGVSNFFDYLQTLNQFKNDIIICIISIRTDYTMINAQHSLEFQKLGLKTDFSNIFGKVYSAIIDGGTVIREDICQDNNFSYALNFEQNLDNYKCKIIAPGRYAFSHLTPAVIINGIDFSSDKCGLNFVIMSKKRNLVVDSVIFGIDNNIPYCTRKHFKFRP